MAPHLITAIVIAVAPALVAVIALSQNNKGFEDTPDQVSKMAESLLPDKAAEIVVYCGNFT